MKNASSRDRARFRPSSFMPFRIFVMTGGNMSGFMFKSRGNR